MSTKDSGAASVSSKTAPHELSVVALVAKLEDSVGAFGDVVGHAVAELAALRAQRDELAAALREVLSDSYKRGALTPERVEMEARARAALNRSTDK